MFVPSSLLSVTVREIRGGADRRYAFDQERSSTAGGLIASAELRVEIARLRRERGGVVKNCAAAPRCAVAPDGSLASVGER
ncbi:hypothetical protein GCM10029978_075490 [Actinoallomurus acanthiterrae]